MNYAKDFNRPKGDLELWYKDVQKIRKYISIERKTGCMKWRGFFRKNSRPSFKSYYAATLCTGGDLISNVQEMYVRKFVLGMWNNDSPNIVATCHNKSNCVNPTHLMVLPAKNSQYWPAETVSMLRSLIFQGYPMTWLSRFYKIPYKRLKKIKHLTD